METRDGSESLGEFVMDDMDKWVGGTCMGSNGILGFLKMIESFGEFLIDGMD